MKAPLNYREIKLLKVGIAYFICIYLSSILPVNIQAQPGIKSGTSISSFYYTNTELNPDLGYDIDLRPYLGYDIEWVQLGNQKPIISPFIGVYYNFQISDRFGIQPELNFSQKGVNFSQFDYETIIYKVKISYLEIPLSITYEMLRKGKFTSDLYLGGYCAFKLNAVKKVGYNSHDSEKTQIKNVKDVETGIHFGLNLKYKMSENFFLFDFRGFIGLSNIFYVPEDQPLLYFNTLKTKTIGFNLTIGYEFE